MAIPANKSELEEAIRISYKKLYLELLGITEKQAKQKELTGHSKSTEMSVHDLLAYLVGWGNLVLKWDRKRENGDEVNFPEKGYKWNELGKLAQKFYGDYSNENYKSLLEKFESVVKEILNLINRKTNRQLYEVDWYEKYTLGRMIQLNTSSPYANARIRIRKWKKEKGL